ncbi:MAG: Archaeal histone HAN1 subunit A [Methanoregulaceae archaeon PtaB.Bin056]|nr:MAG: Archaeal histone HAN1 subunit A [Methanoregulaceae archaeon PtaB.Bin056]
MGSSLVYDLFGDVPGGIYKYFISLYWFEGIKVADLPIAAVVRIAKQSGAERVGSDGAAALVAKAEDYIAHLVKEANKFAVHAGRKTIKEEDVALAVKSL